MTPSIRRLFWLFIPAALMLLAVADGTAPPATWAALIAAWAAGLLRLVPALTVPLRVLRRWLPLYALIWLAAFVAWVVGWLLTFDPAAGVPLQAGDMLYLAAGLFGLLFGFTAGISPEEADALRPRLARWGGVFIALATLVVAVLAVEIGMRYGAVASDAFAFSKMHANWQRLYWGPINSLGYRDTEPAPDDPRPRVIVLGDSLAAGYGVNNISDRFSGVLAGLLGDEALVHTVALPGWGITTARIALESYPVTPDVLILSHYTNDIIEGDAARLMPQPFPTLRLTPDPPLDAWVERSHLVNFAYYRLFHYGASADGPDAPARYADYIRAAYENPAVWAAYEGELQAIIDAAAGYDSALVVIVWPNLANVAGTRDLTAPVVDFFRDAGVPVVDMAALLADEDPARLVVNPFDAHPGPYAHRLAAEALFDTLQANDLP